MKQLGTLDADRDARQERVNNELKSLYASWIIDVRIFNRSGLIAYKFVYDAAGRKISIMPYEKITASPSEYPAKAGTTSELLMLLTAVTQCEYVVDNDVIRHSYRRSRSSLLS